MNSYRVLNQKYVQKIQKKSGNIGRMRRENHGKVLAEGTEEGKRDSGHEE